MKTGWVKLSGIWFYLEPGNGRMFTGLQEVAGNLYSFDSSGAMKTGWAQFEGDWYYHDGSGAAVSGWKKIAGSWYIFDSNSHAMVTGWYQVGEDYYYLTSSGAMAIGWEKVDGVWYYFDDTGLMESDRWMKLGGTWYFFDGSGAMLTGINMIGADVYYFDASGAMKTGWININDYWFYFEASGTMAHDKWVGDYFLQSDGTMAIDMWIGDYYVGPDGKWVPDKQPPEPGPGPDEPMDIDDIIEMHLLSYRYCSRAALIDQLVFDESLSLSEEEAAAAVDAYAERTGFDWNEQALAAAKNLLEYSHVSYDNLKMSLVLYYLFSEDEATFAANNCGADWNEQAVLTIEEIYELNGWSSTPISPREVIMLLTSPVSDEGGIGFTDEQAAYAVEHMDIDWSAEVVRRAEYMTANPDMYGTVTRVVLRALLESDLFTAEQVDLAMESADIDWIAQAKISAKELMVTYEEEGTYYWITRDELISYLIDYYEFTREEAEAGVDAADIDWANQASRCAMGLIDFDDIADGYSYAETLDHVMYAFDRETAEEGIARCNIDWVSEAKAAIQVLIDEDSSWLVTREALLQYLVDIRLFTTEEANTAIDELDLTFDSE